MSLSVRDVLRAGPLEGARVLAGGEGLDRNIHYVDVMEVPDAGAWMRRGLFIISSFYAIKGDEPAQCQLIEAMAAADAAGIAIKLGRFLKELPRRVELLANRYKIPIIEVPDNISYVDITHPILTEILHRQAGMLKQSQRIHQVFTGAALKGGFKIIAETLSSLVGNPVSVCNFTGEILAFSHEKPCPGPEFKVGDLEINIEGLRNCVGGKKEPKTLDFDIGGAHCIVYPILVEDGTYGYILVHVTGKDMEELDLIALEHAGTVAALEMAKQLAIAEVEQRMGHDFLDDLITGVVPSEEIARTRASSLGWNLFPPIVVVVVDIDGFGTLVKEHWDESFAQGVKREMILVTEQVLSIHCSSFVVVGRSDSAIALLSLSSKIGVMNEEKVNSIILDLKEKLEKKLNSVSVSIGVSKPGQNLLDIGKRYRESFELIKIGRIVFGPGTIATNDRLSAYRLFYQYQPKEELARFCRSIVGEIIKYDRKNSTAFLGTLRAYFEHGGKIKETAESLFVHRNTLRYRLKRIEEITGFDLHNSSHGFMLNLALHMLPFLHGDDLYTPH